jgi:hypothetical protein
MNIEQVQMIDGRLNGPTVVFRRTVTRAQRLERGQASSVTPARNNRALIGFIAYSIALALRLKRARHVTAIAMARMKKPVR